VNISIRSLCRARGLSVALLGVGLVVGSLLSGPAPAQAQAQAQAQEFDINKLFDCTPGGPLGKQMPQQCEVARDKMLAACTSCHAFVPIVKAHKNDAGWRATMSSHRDRVNNLNDEEIEQVRLFLVAHFNDKRPVPVLPPELEALNTLPPA
jgi:hypothetical protein